MSVVFGSAFFWIVVGGGRPAACLRSLPVAATRTAWLLRVAAPFAAASGLGWLAATIANVTGDPASILDAGMLRVFFFETPFGPPSLARVCLLALLAITTVLPLAPQVMMPVTAVVAATLLASQARLGHAAEGGPNGPAMIAAYAIHVVGAAAWVGGLPPLAFAIGERWRRGEGSLDLLARYSAMACVAVALVVLSGLANTLFHAGGDLGGLASSSYGEVLFTKLALVAAMLVLAAANRALIMPRLRVHGRAERITRALRTSVAVEAFLAILVLGAAAVLGITPPPR